ncbi:MAG: hypothetical protein HY055_00805 [Magnetospirillum sp.]|nr:hypothetical protein [Magnetospirillum sp.]
MSANLTVETFLPHVDQAFAAQFSDGELSMTLTLAQLLKGGPSPASIRPPFELRFTCPVHLRQQTYLLRHEQLGEQEIFLVPVAQEGETFVYQAVFN